MCRQLNLTACLFWVLTFLVVAILIIKAPARGTTQHDCKALYQSVVIAARGVRDNTPESTAVADVRALHGPESSTSIVHRIYGVPRADVHTEVRDIRRAIDRECF